MTWELAQGIMGVIAAGVVCLFLVITIIEFIHGPR